MSTFKTHYETKFNTLFGTKNGHKMTIQLTIKNKNKIYIKDTFISLTRLLIYDIKCVNITKHIHPVKGEIRHGISDDL